MDDLTFNFEVIESKKDIDIGILIYDSTYINFLKLQNEKYYKIDSQTKLTDLIKNGDYTQISASITTFEDFLELVVVPSGSTSQTARKVNFYNNFLIDCSHYNFNIILINCSTAEIPAIKQAFNQNKIKAFSYDPLKTTICNDFKTIIKEKRCPVIFNCLNKSNRLLEESYVNSNQIISSIALNELNLRIFNDEDFQVLTYSIAGLKRKFWYYRSNNVVSDKKIIPIPLMSDAIGSFSRSLNSIPWLPPAGYVRGKILNQDFEATIENPTATSPKEGIVPSTPSNLNDLESVYDKGINLPIEIFGTDNIKSFYINSDVSGYTGAIYPLKQSISYSNLIFDVVSNIQYVLNSSLFEFNDEATRNLIKIRIEQYLQFAKANSGIDDFVVVCDSSNNNETDYINRRVNVDVSIKPSQSINFVELSFTT
jgi:hypothetical protein